MKKLLLFPAIFVLSGFSFSSEAGCNVFRSQSGDQATTDITTELVSSCDSINSIRVPDTEEPEVPEPVEPEGPSEEDKNAWVVFAKEYCRTTVPDFESLVNRTSAINCYNQDATSLPPPAPTYFSAHLNLGYNQLESLHGLSLLESAQSLNLSYIDTITDYSDLSNLREVGYLTGSWADNLQSLNGLQSLETARGLIFYANKSLTDISALSNVTSPVEVVQFQSTPISDISPLSGIESIGDLTISATNVDSLLPLRGIPITGEVKVNNNNLTTLEGLESLVTLPDRSWFWATSNDLRDLNGLENLTQAAYLKFDNNRNLRDVTGIRNVSKANRVDFFDAVNNIEIKIDGDAPFCDNWRKGNINVSGAVYGMLCQEMSPDDESDDDLWVIFINEECSRSDPFETLQEIENYTSGIGCSSRDLSQFPENPAPTKFGRISFKNNQFTSLQGWENVQSVDFINLYGNKLTHLDQLSSLVSANELNLVRNDLSNLSGLSNLTQLGKLTLNYNNLKNLNGLEGLTHVDHLDVGQNDLVSLDGLNNLSSAGTLSIRQNYNLSDISALRNLQQVESLHLDSTVTSLHDLSALQSAGTLIFTGGKLTSLSGLSNLRSLKSLHAASNDIRDISVLINITSVDDIRLSHNEISAPSGLDNLTTITNMLDLSYNKLSTLAPLANIDNAKEIRLWGAIEPGVTIPLRTDTAFCMSVEDGSIQNLSLGGASIEDVCDDSPLTHDGVWVWSDESPISRVNRENVPAEAPPLTCMVDSSYTYTPTYNQDAFAVTSMSNPDSSCLGFQPYPDAKEGEDDTTYASNRYEFSEPDGSYGVCHPANHYTCIELTGNEDRWVVTNSIPSENIDSLSPEARSAFVNSHNRGEITTLFTIDLESKICLNNGDKYLRKVNDNYLSYTCGGVREAGTLEPVPDIYCDTDNGENLDEPIRTGNWSPASLNSFTSTRQEATAEQRRNVSCYEGVINTQTGDLTAGDFLYEEEQIVETTVERTVENHYIKAMQTGTPLCSSASPYPSEVPAGQVFLRSGRCTYEERRVYFYFLDGKLLRHNTSATNFYNNENKWRYITNYFYDEGTNTDPDHIGPGGRAVTEYPRDRLDNCTGYVREYLDENGIPRTWDYIWGGSVIKSGIFDAPGKLKIGPYMYSALRKDSKDPSERSVFDGYKEYHLCRKESSVEWRYYNDIIDMSDAEVEAYFYP